MSTAILNPTFELLSQCVMLPNNSCQIMGMDSLFQGVSISFHYIASLILFLIISNPHSIPLYIHYSNCPKRPVKLLSCPKLSNGSIRK